MKKSNAAVIALTGFAALAFALTQAQAGLAAPGAVPPAGNVIPTFNGLNILPTNNIKLSVDPTSGYISNDSGSSFVIFNDPQGIGLNNGAGITGVGQNVIFKDSGSGNTKIDALIPLFNSTVVGLADQPLKIADGAGLQLANDSGTSSLLISGTLGSLSNLLPGSGVSVADTQGLSVANDSGVAVFSVNGGDGSIRRPDSSYPLRIADTNGFEIADEASSVYFKLAGTGDLLHPAGTIFNPHITGGVDDPISISDKLKVTTTAGPAVEATGLTGGRFANTLGTNTVNLGTATAAVDAVGIIKNAGLSIAANGDISDLNRPVTVSDDGGLHIQSVNNPAVKPEVDLYNGYITNSYTGGWNPVEIQDTQGLKLYSGTGVDSRLNMEGFLYNDSALYGGKLTIRDSNGVLFRHDQTAPLLSVPVDVNGHLYNSEATINGGALQIRDSDGLQLANNAASVQTTIETSGDITATQYEIDQAPGTYWGVGLPGSYLTIDSLTSNCDNFLTAPVENNFPCAVMMNSQTLGGIITAQQYIGGGLYIGTSGARTAGGATIWTTNGGLTIDSNGNGGLRINSVTGGINLDTTSGGITNGTGSNGVTLKLADPDGTNVTGNLSVASDITAGSDVFATNRIGISTTTPGAGLHIKSTGWPGSFIFLDTDAVGQDAGIRFQSAGVLRGHIYNQANVDNDLLILSDAAAGIRVESGTGYLGIGAGGPGAGSVGWRITLPNSGAIAGGGMASAWGIYSDERVKKEQSPLSYGLKEVMALQPKSYDHYSSDFSDGKLVLAKDFTREIGLVAQEVYKIIPEAVNKPADEIKELWGLDYDKLIPVLVKAVQELKTENDELKAEIAEMKQAICEIKPTAAVCD